MTDYRVIETKYN